MYTTTTKYKENDKENDAAKRYQRSHRVPDLCFVNQKQTRKTEGNGEPG